MSKAFTAAALAGAVLAMPLAASAGAQPAPDSKPARADSGLMIYAAPAPSVVAASAGPNDLFGALDAAVDLMRPRATERFSTEPLPTSVALDGVSYPALGAPAGAAATVGLKASAPATSRLPEPATWAMMMLGFGGAGALMRRHGRGGGHRYRLVERLPGGDERCEEFGAPDDATALARATLVAEGRIEVYRGDMRVLPQA